jgi:CSLREA domain-containing protein
VFFIFSTNTHAADADFSDGITVDSVLDNPDASIGNTSCADAGGFCTLRAAIQEANSNPDVSTILFNISGSGVRTIQPLSGLPQITEQVVINGYSQIGSQPNTAPAPSPLNGILLIEIDGANAGTNVDVFRFDTGSEDSVIRGLVIGNFSDSSAVSMQASNVTVQGNYIGTDSTGLVARPNEVGVNHGGTAGSGPGALIGGLNPEDRNIISGNTDGPTATAGYPSTGWVIQGNYVGVGADGVTAIPNSTLSGSGAFSIDDCPDVLVGGTAPGAMNVISGNTSYGLAPHNAPNLMIQGNYIGTDYTGTQAVPNTVGIISSGDGTGSAIGGTSASARNIISGNNIGIVAATAGKLRIEGNYIGLEVDGQTVLSNILGTILTGDFIFGGSTAGRNVVAGNTVMNVSVQGTFSATFDGEVSSNYIGTNTDGEVDQSITDAQGEGVRVSADSHNILIGGEGKGNRIAGNRGSGVAVRSVTEIANLGGATITPTNVAILGNQIYANTTGGPIVGAQGLGIDIYSATINDIFLQPIPADIMANSYANLGPTPNDALDSDTGPNGNINFPVLNSVTQKGDQATINFSLDAAGSPVDQYRIEFFANDEADASGYGEGQTYLGFTTAAIGNNQQAGITLPTNVNLAGKSISATTTSVDASTDSGFGATSEFSQIVMAEVKSATSGSNTQGTLAKSGEHQLMIWLAGVYLVVIAGSILYKKLSTQLR